MNQRISQSTPTTQAALAAQLAALAHPARLDILTHLARRQCCCKDVVEQFDLAQSTVSQHLKVLVEAGLIHQASDRQKSLYRIDAGAMAALSEAVSGLVDSCCKSSGTETEP